MLNISPISQKISDCIAHHWRRFVWFTYNVCCAQFIDGNLSLLMKKHDTSCIIKGTLLLHSSKLCAWNKINNSPNMKKASRTSMFITMVHSKDNLWSGTILRFSVKWATSLNYGMLHAFLYCISLPFFIFNVLITQMYKVLSLAKTRCNFS